MNSTTTIILISTQDGNYTLWVTRALADVDQLQLFSYDHYGVATTLNLVPPFTTGNYNYDTWMPYGAASAAVYADTILGDPTKLTYELTGNQPVSMALVGYNLVRMNDSLDGQYFFVMHRNAPDIAGINAQLIDGRILVWSAPISGAITPAVNYSGAATGGTAGAIHRDWYANVHTYSFIIPYVYTDVELLIGYATSSTVTIASTVNPVVQLLSGAPTILHIPIAVGQNTIQINSTLDGYYELLIDRLVPDCSNVLVVPVKTNSIGYWTLPSAALVPIFHPQTMNYSISVPYITASLSVNVTYWTVGSVELIVPATGQHQWLTSIQNSVDVPLPLLATANTTTFIELHSSQDGVYYLEVTRLVADVIDIQLQSFDLHLVPTPLTLIPSFTLGLYIYHANYPYGGKSALVSVTTTVEPTTATITIDHSGTPIALLYPLTRNIISIVLWMVNILSSFTVSHPILSV